MKVIAVESVEALEEWAAPYAELLGRIGGLESLYYSIDCIRITQHPLSALGVSMFFLLILEQDELRAVLPLQLTRDLPGGLRRRIGIWGVTDALYSSNSVRTFLVDGVEPKAMEAAAFALQNTLRARWDRLEFFCLDTAEENLSRFIAGLARAVTEERDMYYHYYDRAAGLEDCLGKKRMTNLQRCRRRLEEDFTSIDVSVKTAVSEEDYEALKALHTRRQADKGSQGAFFSNTMEEAYIRDLVQLWNERQCVRYYTLRVDGRLIAFQLVYASGGTAMSYIIAFDSAFSKYSPQHLLTYEMFRREVETFGTRRIETGRGPDKDPHSSAYKNDFCSGRTALHDVTVNNRTLRAAIIQVVIRCRSRIRCRRQAPAQRTDPRSRLVKKKRRPDDRRS